MASTQQKIADHLNISRSLVALALSNTPGARVSEHTRRRVLHAARELGYRANTAARSLRTGRTNTVTFVHAGTGKSPVNESYMAGIQGCARELGALNYELKLRFHTSEDELIASLDDMASSRSTDAIILWSSEEDIEAPGNFLQSRGFPFVAKGRLEKTHPDWPQVDFDHEMMMTAAVSALGAAGHTRIAYLGHDNKAVYSARLLCGFRFALEELIGCQVDNDLIAEVAPSPSAAQSIVAEWIKLPESRKPTAIVVGAGAQAWMGIELALASVGRRIGVGPGNFGVAGMGSRGISTLFGDGLCFEETDLDSLAAVMVRRLLAPILEGRKPAERIVRVCPQLSRTQNLNLMEYVQFATQPE